MTVHEVKSWPDFFTPIDEGQKTFDLRFNDRKYQQGDILRLQEYDDAKRAFTGRVCERRITYVMVGVGGGCILPLRGLMREYVILGLEPVFAERRTLVADGPMRFEPINDDPEGHARRESA